MQININTANCDWQFEKAKRYLPVRLSTTYFEHFGECIVIIANRADGRMTDIIENDESEVFITLMDSKLYEVIKSKVLNMDYWSPINHYNTCDGLVDGKPRKIHLDGMVF